MESAHADLLTGRMLDRRYHVRSRIAHGGMATVYLATDTRLEREVALKVMHADLARDAAFVDRFIGEAKSVARLSHPNIVAVFDQGADGQYLYLAMEYVPGRTLRALLRERGWLPWQDALALMDPVLAGLAAAHQAGLVHRDVKPENVLITADGRVKVVDFGLARASAAVGNTRAGMIIGSVAYIAPEQVTGAATDARSDVYAAGIMLFEMLTGRQPFTGETPLAVAYAHVNTDVPAISSLAGGIPPAVDQLVRAATSRDPARRPPNAGAFLHAVRALRGMGAAEAGDSSTGAFGPAGPVFAGGALTGRAGNAAGSGGAADGFGGAGQFDGADRFEGANGFGGPSVAGGHGGSSGSRTMVVEPGYDAAGSTYDVATGRFNAGAGLAAGNGYGAGGYGGGYGDGNYGGYGGPGPAGADHREGEREPFLQRWLFSRRLVYVAIAVVVALALGGGGWYLTSGRYTNLPSVGGTPVAQAEAALREAGFTPKVGSSVINDSVTKGDVVSTSPSGRALPGATVVLTLSLGPRMISVPSVAGLPSVQAADAKLRAAGLTVAAATKPVGVNPPVDMGAIAGTSPPAGTSWPQNQPVYVEVVAGLALPPFVGENISDVQNWAAQNHITIQPTSVANNQPQGVIVSQSPAAGTPVQPGSTVDVSVSQGPPMVQIPNLQGQSCQQAQQTLQQLGFQVSTRTFFFGNQVFSTNPSGQAPSGSTVTLTCY
jgi:eukaryotic-like serine/threonine-protein kinase